MPSIKKFRAWDKVEGHYWNDLLNIGTAGRPEFDCADEYFECDEFIIEQYTGLKDNNGKEIYEGDIVEEDIEFNSKMADGTFRYKVYWNEDELCWSLDPIGPESIHDDLWELNSSRRVIGNVHENSYSERSEE